MNSLTTDQRSTTLIICPTYNERTNIAPFIGKVLTLYPDIAILFVNDAGRDDTAGEIINHRQRGKITLLNSDKKTGLGDAYRRGFSWGMTRAFDYFITMDVDLSHNPIYIADLCRLLTKVDIAIASRYVAGGSCQNWPVSRKLISRCGSLYTRAILRSPIRDMTAGYVGYRRTAVQKIAIDNTQTQGFAFQIETKYRALHNDLTLEELPITFSDRQRGRSKMSLAIVIEALLYPLRVKLRGRKLIDKASR